MLLNVCDLEEANQSKRCLGDKSCCIMIVFITVQLNSTEIILFSKKRGLGDRDKLPYFPYRDDGELILDAISNMVNEYVDQ